MRSIPNSDGSMNRNRKLIISIGSNFNQRENIDYAKKQLTTVLDGDTAFSEELWTMPVGIESDKFINCVCVSSTSHTYTQIRNALKHIERKCGRTKKNDMSNRIPLDLDILMYGEEMHHSDDWDRDYIKKLLNDFGNKQDYFIQDPTI